MSTNPASAPPNLCTVKHTIDVRAHVGEPVFASAQRYTWALAEEHDSPGTIAENRPTRSSSSGTGFTLVFCHALSYPKALWEPTISHLFELAHRPGRAKSAPRITEAWTIDGLDHGESAVLNEEWLSVQTTRVECVQYSQVIVALLQSGLLSDPHPSRVILVAHSAGGISAILSTTLFALLSQVPFCSIVLIEPWMVTVEMEAANAQMRAVTAALVRTCAARRDVWGSRDEAREYFRSKKAWGAWDPRAVDLYVEYGLRSLPSRVYPDQKSGVTLAFPKKDESEAYGDYREGRTALDTLGRLSEAMPIHAIFGDEQPRVVKEMQNTICARPRRMASITYLPKTAHTAPQESPGLVAGAIWDILAKTTEQRQGSRIAREKL